MTILNALFYQDKGANSKTGFRISDKTSKTISDESIFWWLMGNLLKWQILSECTTGEKFRLDKHIDIDLSIGNKRKRLYFTTTQNQVLRTFVYEGTSYTIKNMETGTHLSYTDSLNLYRLTNYIEYTTIVLSKNIGPLITTPMRD